MIAGTSDVLEEGVSVEVQDARVTEEDSVREVKEEKKVADIKNLYASVYSFNLFTITDGAIRLIVLLHAAQLSFSPIQIAFMFMLYEIAGVVTNLFGGIAGVRWGLKKTLFLSLICQVLGLTCLILVNPIFDLYSYNAENPVPEDVALKTTIYITFCQMLSGVSKDFMKISCKSVPKLVTKEGENGSLFKLVAWVTGMKNSFKGFGTMLGAILVQFTSFEIAIGILLGIIVMIIPVPLYLMDWDLGKGNKKAAKFLTWDVFKKGKDVNVLSLARVFLFASRDVWFEIAAPLFLTSVMGWPRFTAGIFMGGYIIMYGNFQTVTSKMYKQAKVAKVNSTDDGAATSGDSADKPKRLCRRKSGPPTSKSVPFWAWACAIDLFVWGSIMYPLYREYATTAGESQKSFQIGLSVVLITGLFIFAFVFAVNSAVHSYLIVLYSENDKASADLGFYYMANAAGRLVGTMLSGVIYQFTEEQYGLSVCLWTAAAFMAVAAVIGYWLPEEDDKEAGKGN